MAAGSLCMLIACSGSDQKSSPSSDSTQQTKQNDSEETSNEKVLPPFYNPVIDTLQESQVKSLSKYFKKSTVEQFVSAHQALRGAQTDADFEKAYQAFRPLFTVMETELEKKNDDPTYWIDQLTVFKKIKLIEPGCAAECTKFLFFWNYEALKKAAKETEGNADENFFALKSEAEYNVATFDPQWLAIFERTWDYGGGVTVGDNRAYKWLKKAYEFQQASPLFKADIDNIRTDMVRTVGHPVYMKKQEVVQAELKKIYQSNFISKEEKKMIKQWMDRNAAFDTAKEPLLQFGCETGDCDWGG